MIKFKLLITLLLISVFGHAQHNFNNAPTLPSPRSGWDWVLDEDVSTDFSQWSDFTNGWNRHYPACNGNIWRGPGQTFFKAENSRLNSGKLELVASQGSGTKTEQSASGNNITLPNINCGIISSKKRIRYPVYAEIRVKAANMMGSSNFWAINGDVDQEIDALEVYGGGEATDSYMDWFTYRAATNFHFFRRTTSDCTGGLTFEPGGVANTDFHDQKRIVRSTRWRNAYHTFGFLWRSPTSIEFYVDGVRQNGHGLQASSPFIHLFNGQKGRNIGTSSTDPQKAVTEAVNLIIDLEIHDYLSFGRNDQNRSIAPNLNGYEFGGGNNIMKVDWVRVYNEVQNGGGSTGGGTSGGGSTSAEYNLSSVNGGRFLTPENGSGNNGARIVKTSGRAGNAKKWILVGSGTYKEIKNVATGKCLGIAGGSTSNGGKAVQWTCNGNPDQRWQQIARSNGQFSFQNQNSSKCLDVTANGGDNVQLHQWNCSSSNNNQRFWISSPNSRNGDKELVIDEISELAVYPNPASNELTVSGLDGDKVSILIINTQGKVVMDEVAAPITGSTTLDISALESGAYIVKAGSSISKFMKK